jgi:hypothetical protein
MDMMGQLVLMGTVKSGTYEWKPYTKTLPDHYEHTRRILLFEVPQSINPEKSYIQVDFFRIVHA